MLTSFSEQKALQLICIITMNKGPKTQRRDHLEGLRKMERSLKEGEPIKPPAMTRLGQILAKLEETKYDLAFAELLIFEAEAAFNKGKPDMSDAQIERHEVQLARMRAIRTKIENAYRLKEAECEELRGK